MVTEKRAEISRLRGAKSVMSQRGKFEFNALLYSFLRPSLMRISL